MFLIWLDLLPQMQAFEHRLPRGYEKAALHQVIRAAKLKQLLMFDLVRLITADASF